MPVGMRSWLVRCLSLALLAGWGGVLHVSSASAAPGWTLQPTPSPAGASSALLRGTSCLTSTVCMAVGSWDNAGDDVDVG